VHIELGVICCRLRKVVEEEIVAGVETYEKEMSYTHMDCWFHRKIMSKFGAKMDQIGHVADQLSFVGCLWTVVYAAQT
jgi:hypothetical protein